VETAKFNGFFGLGGGEHHHGNPHDYVDYD
jgi:hypothetical protein